MLNTLGIFLSHSYCSTIKENLFLFRNSLQVEIIFWRHYQAKERSLKEWIFVNSKVLNYLFESEEKTQIWTVNPACQELFNPFGFSDTACIFRFWGRISFAVKWLKWEISQKKKFIFLIEMRPFIWKIKSEFWNNIWGDMVFYLNLRIYHLTFLKLQMSLSKKIFKISKLLSQIDLAWAIWDKLKML